MRQLSLTETETFVNLAKHALETLRASDDDDADVKDAPAPRRYSDDNDDADDVTADSPAAGVTGHHGSALKAIQSEPVFKRRGKKSLGRVVVGMGQMEEAEEAIELESRWSAPRSSEPDIDDDMLQFVARSSSDVRLDSADVDDDAPSGDETTHLANAANLRLC